MLTAARFEKQPLSRGRFAMRNLYIRGWNALVAELGLANATQFVMQPPDGEHSNFSLVNNADEPCLDFLEIMQGINAEAPHLATSE